MPGARDKLISSLAILSARTTEVKTIVEIREVVVESKKTIQVGDGKQYVSALIRESLVFESGELRLADLPEDADIESYLVAVGNQVENLVDSRLSAYTGDGDFENAADREKKKAGKPPTKNQKRLDGDESVAEEKFVKAVFGKKYALKDLGREKQADDVVELHLKAAGVKKPNALSQDAVEKLLDALSEEIKDAEGK